MNTESQQNTDNTHRSILLLNQSPSSPYELMLSDGTVGDVLEAAGKTTAFELESAANLLETNDVRKISDYAVRKCRSATAYADIYSGGILELAAIGSKEQATPEIFEEIIQEIGISRTQAFRCRGIWRGFGPQLLADSKLIPMFCSESLKILSEGRSTPEARAAALEMAKNGQAITIRVAKRIRREHAGQQSTESTRVARANAPKAKHDDSSWSFHGRVVSVVLTPRGKASLADVAAVVRDLKAAIEDLLRSEADQSAV